eukprot:45285_1
MSTSNDEWKEQKEHVNTLFVVGDNGNGHLGFGHSDFNIEELTEWRQKPHIVKVHCGSGYTILRDKKGNMWCSGSNSNGSLGFKEGVTDYALRQNKYFIKHNINIKSILTSPSSNATFFQTQTNRLYACGGNHCNKLAMASNQIEEPCLIHNVSNIKDAKSGASHTILLDNNGIVYSTYIYDSRAYGQNGDGLNNFSNTNSKAFHQIPFFHNKRITQIS